MPSRQYCHVHSFREWSGSCAFTFTSDGGATTGYFTQASSHWWHHITSGFLPHTHANSVRGTRRPRRVFVGSVLRFKDSSVESNVQRSPVHARHIRGMKRPRTRRAGDVHANAIDILRTHTLRAHWGLEAAAAEAEAAGAVTAKATAAAAAAACLAA